MNLLPTASFLEYKIINNKTLSHPKIIKRNNHKLETKIMIKTAQESESSENAPPEEVNALYERLLQEMESKSKNLDDEKQRAIGTIPKGRDY
jgi:superfamily I DNA and RNA helicase